MGEAIPAETKEIINPRVEIDTSAPFESVKEAVSHFAGNRPRNRPHDHFLPPRQNSREEFDVNQMEEQAARLERVLISRERETLDVLRELEEAKSTVEGLKASLMRGGRGSMLSFYPAASPPRSILTSFDKAASTLNKTSIDLAVIRASVESLNKIMSNEEGEPERSSEAIPVKEEHEIAPLQFNFEAEQFKKMVEASRYETMKAMAEIERTKISIRMAEMRLNAAKKIEEAAKAVEAIAFAETKSLLNPNKPEEITLPFEEYNSLSYRDKETDDLFGTKFMYRESRNQQSSTEESYGLYIRRSEYEKMQEPGNGSLQCNCRFQGPDYSSIDRKDSCLLPGDKSNKGEEKSVPVYRSPISIGDILTRKLVLEKHVEARGERRQQRSLSQLLREPGGFILHRAKSMKCRGTDKQYFSHKMKFGFIHIPLSKHNKKKATAVLNSS